MGMKLADAVRTTDTDHSVHFSYSSALLGRREWVSKQSILCTLVKILRIMDDPLLD